MPIDIKPTGKSISLEELVKQQKPVSIAKMNISAPKKEENAEEPKENGEKKRDRFYLPVLYINDPTQWESKPLSERKHFTPEVAKDTCVGNCCGVEGLRAGCCQLDPDDIEHVLGPVDEDWIKKTIKWFKNKGISLTRHDIVIDFEEGKLIGRTFFNDHEVFKSPDSYPILRIQANGQRFACKFLNVYNGMCTIYPVRPGMCSSYLCAYVKSNFLVKTENHPNTYKKIDPK
jgi:Fe-S-cluster containining protein